MGAPYHVSAAAMLTSNRLPTPAATFRYRQTLG